MKMKNINVQNTARSDIFIVDIDYSKWRLRDLSFVYKTGSYYYSTNLLDGDGVPPFMPTKDSLKEGFKTIYHHEQPKLYKTLLSHVMAHVLKQVI